MARQKTYINDTDLTGLDRLTGVNAESGATVNYTLDAIASFFAQSGNSDGTRLGFNFSYGGVYNPDEALEDGKIYLSFLNGAGEDVGFSQVTGAYFKNVSQDNADFKPVRGQLEGGTIKLTNVSSPGSRGYGLYQVASASAIDDADTQTYLQLTELASTGEMGLDQFVVSPFGTGNSGGGGSDDANQFYAGSYDPNSVSDFGSVGDIFFRTDINAYYRKGLSGWGDPVTLKGDPGDFDEAVVDATVTLEAGQDAQVQLRNDNENGIVGFTFRIPRGTDGAEGPQGPVTPFTFGTTKTGVPGSSASVENTGTETAPNLIFTVPQGEKGEKGDTGTGSTINVNGPNDFSETGITTVTFAGTAVTEIVRPEGSDDVTVTLTDTDTTYTAGAGIGIENGVITNTRPDTNTQLTDAEVIQAIVNSTNISSIDQQTIRENIGAEGGGGSDYTLPIATASTLGGVRVPGTSKININALGQIDVEDITASDINSESATTGQILTADGSGGAIWSAPTDASLPLAADGTRGGIQIGYTETGNNYAVRLDGEQAYVTVPSSGTYTLPAATTSSLGGIIVGSGLSVTSGGVLSATGGGAGGSTILVNGDTIDNPNFITYENVGGITFQIAEGATDVIEASVNSQISNTSVAVEGYVLAADGIGGVRWEATDNTLAWVEGNDSYTGIDTIIAGEHVVFTRGTGNDIDRLTISIDPITGVGTHVNIDGSNRDQVNIDSNDTEVGGIDVEFNTNTNILTFALGTHGAGNNQLLGTNSDGDLEWRDPSEDTGTVVRVNTTEFENVDFRDGTARVGGIDLTTAAQDVTFDVSKHGSSADQIFATNSDGDFEWVDKESHTPHDIKVNGTSVSDPDFKDAGNGTDDITVGVKFNHSGSDVTAGINSDDLRDATSSLKGVVKLGNDTVQTVAPASDTPFSIANRTYFVQVDSQGRLVVNVPWSSQTGNPPTLSDINWNFDPNGAASQNITVMVTTAKMDAANTNYNLTVTSSSGTVVSGDIDNPTDQQHSITINSFTGGTVTAVLTYRFEGESSDQMITKTRTGMLNENTPEQVAFLSNPSGFEISHTNGEVEAFDTGTFDVLTKSQYESEANLEGWTIGTITYAPTLNTDGKLEIGATDTSYGLAATATITKSGQTMNNYRLNNDNEGTINRVKSFRSGGLTNVGSDTTLTPAQIADITTFKDDLITSKTDAPSNYTWQATVAVSGQRQYFAYSSEFNEADLDASRQQGLAPLTMLYDYKGVINGFHVYVGVSGVLDGEGVMNTLQLKT